MTEIFKGHRLYGTVKVGERGQIVIPLEARKHFDIKAGDLLLVIGHRDMAIVIVKADAVKKIALGIFEAINRKESETEEESGR